MKNLLLYLTDLMAACLQSIPLVRFMFIPLSSAMKSVVIDTETKGKLKIRLQTFCLEETSV